MPMMESRLEMPLAFNPKLSVSAHTTHNRTDYSKLQFKQSPRVGLSMLSRKRKVSELCEDLMSPWTTAVQVSDYSVSLVTDI